MKIVPGKRKSSASTVTVNFATFIFGAGQYIKRWASGTIAGIVVHRGLKSLAGAKTRTGGHAD